MGQVEGEREIGGEGGEVRGGEKRQREIEEGRE